MQPVAKRPRHSSAPQPLIKNISLSIVKNNNTIARTVTPTFIITPDPMRASTMNNGIFKPPVRAKAAVPIITPKDHIPPATTDKSTIPTVLLSNEAEEARTVAKNTKRKRRGVR
ncbi:hypothetical protein TWF694_009017 [Orbilia ellipsospora]|uniref:Uncharacterized protein n=1 Tax=Orbilia ellipsospora TaxID=2528407 RepID=A0AAV9XK34_9PEZI